MISLTKKDTDLKVLLSFQDTGFYPLEGDLNISPRFESKISAAKIIALMIDN